MLLTVVADGCLGAAAVVVAGDHAVGVHVSDQAVSDVNRRSSCLNTTFHEGKHTDGDMRPSFMLCCCVWLLHSGQQAL